MAGLRGQPARLPALAGRGGALMSWNAPQNYAEALWSIERGWCFSSALLGLAGESIGVLSDAGRCLPTWQRDRMAGEIIASNRLQHQRYMAKGSRCYEADDVVYFVTRGGRALAYVTRNGVVTVNLAYVARGGVVTVNHTLLSSSERVALMRIMPALQALAKRYAATSVAE